MTDNTTGQISIDYDEKSVKYHEENPHIYEKFKEITLEAIDIRGFKHWSTNGVFEIMRWFTKTSGNDEWKVNNNYRAFYARKFAEDFPQHRGFFRTRPSKFDQ